MTLDLDDLERKARAAKTGAPWRLGAIIRTRVYGGRNGYIVARDVPEREAAHIAANSPDVTLALIAALREARAERERLIGYAAAIEAQAEIAQDEARVERDALRAQLREARAERDTAKQEIADAWWMLGHPYRDQYGKLTDALADIAKRLQAAENPPDWSDGFAEGKKTNEFLVKAAQQRADRVEAERDALRTELDLWQHCANCHERMDAPGHCGNAESEAERGWRETAEGYLDQIRTLRAQLTAATTWSDETLNQAWRAAVAAESAVWYDAGSADEAEAAGCAAMRAVLTAQEPPK